MRRALVMVVCGLVVLSVSALVAPLTESQQGSAGEAVEVEEVRVPGQSRTMLPDGRLLYLGGMRGIDPQTIAEIRDPDTGEIVQQSTALQHPRAWHTATVLPNGKILVLGGMSQNQELSGSIELLDPETLESEVLPAPSMIVRAHHTATLLTDGNVLIVGGISPAGDLIDTVELWHPESRTADRIDAKLRSGRRDHSAVLRRDGTVLHFDGVDEFNGRFDFGEVYYPDRQRFHVETLRGEKHKESRLAYLEDSMPPSGAADVPVDESMSLRFSTLLAPHSVDQDTIRLEGPQGVIQAQVVVAEEGRLVFVTPMQNLFPEATYVVTVDGVVDRDGQAVAPTGVTFHTVGVPHDKERWLPQPEHFTGDWTSGRAPSPWEKIPPLQAAPGVTALAGQVLALHGRPLGNVTVQLGETTATTDHTGRFLLSGIPAGSQPLTVDGRTANQPGKTYGLFIFKVEVANEGRTNVLPYTIWMPLLDTANATSFPSPTQSEVVATTPLIPGFEVRIPEGAVLRSIEGEPINSMSITPIPIDRPPFPLPRGVRFPVYFTLQPGGAVLEGEVAFKHGVSTVFPNYGNLPPRSRVDLWSYDPLVLGWYIYGQATVTQDGSHIIPDPGVGVRVLTCTSSTFRDPATAPGTAAVPDRNAPKGGDPVDLGTGLFVYSETDIVIPDVIPIVLTRVYRQNDPVIRSFGKAATHSYDLYLVGDNDTYSYAELILPDGGRLYYDRITPGTNEHDAVFLHTTSPTRFQNSTLQLDTDGSGNWMLTLTDGTVYRFLKIGAQLLKITDRFGNAMTFQYGSSQITKITSPNGRWIQLDYTPQPNDKKIAKITDNIGREVNYTYDSEGRLETVTDQGSGVTTYSYTGPGSDRLETIEDALGILYLRNTYDATSGRIEKQRLNEDSNIEYHFAYTIDAGTSKIIQTDVTDPRGNVRRVTFNAEGYMTSDTYALGDPNLERKTTYGRETGTNLVTSIKDHFDRVTEFTYTNGQVDTITRLFGTPNAVTTDIDYEPNFGLVSKIKDPLGHDTDLEYDALGNLTRIIDAEMNATKIEYNSAGQPTAVIDPNDERTEFVYNLGDLVEVLDPTPNSTKSFTDSVGRVRSVTDAVGNVTLYDYDGLNQLTSITDPLAGVTEFTYDGNGNMLTVKDARQSIVTYRYDDFDRLETRTDALGDPLNPLANPDHYEEYKYDGMGNLTKHTDRRGKITTLRYDVLDRLEFAGFGTTGVEPSLMFESFITYSYDDPNNRVTVTDSVTGTVILEYDDLGRLTNESTPNGSLSYTYDEADRLKTLTVAGETTVVYEYYDNNQLKTVTQGSKVVTLDYYETGLRRTLALPHGISTNYKFDKAARLTELEYMHDTNILGDLDYGYDARGLRTTVGGSFARTGLPDAISPATYDEANRLTQWGTINTLDYDNNGNLTFDGTNTFTWNARNQLESMTGGVFEYDSLGRRSKKTLGETTDFLFSGLNVVQEQASDEADSILGLNIDEFFFRIEGTAERIPIADGLGSTVALLDPNGELSTEYTYEPFGETSISGPDSSSFQFTGRENDATELYYYRARYYSPHWYRFLSEDPLGIAGGDLNYYVYVSNSPVNFRDPLGLAVSQCGNTPSAPPTSGRPSSMPPPEVEEPANPAGVLFTPGSKTVSVTVNAQRLRIKLINTSFIPPAAVVKVAVRTTGGYGLGTRDFTIPYIPFFTYEAVFDSIPTLSPTPMDLQVTVHVLNDAYVGASFFSVSQQKGNGQCQ